MDISRLEDFPGLALSKLKKLSGGELRDALYSWKERGNVAIDGEPDRTWICRMSADRTCDCCGIPQSMGPYFFAMGFTANDAFERCIEQAEEYVQRTGEFR